MTAVVGPVAADFSASLAAPVHLNVVLRSRLAVSQRTPWPTRQPLSGPCATSWRQLKPPDVWATPVIGSKAPPPESATAPVRKPAISVALKPKPTLPEAATGTAIEAAMAASATATSNVFRVILFSSRAIRFESPACLAGIGDERAKALRRLVHRRISP